MPDEDHTYLVPGDLLAELARFVRVRKASEPDARRLHTRLELHTRGPIPATIDDVHAIIHTTNEEI